MAKDKFTSAEIARLFLTSDSPQTIKRKETSGILPEAKRAVTNKNSRYWSSDQLPLLAEHYGLLKPTKKAKVIATFGNKGGIYKTFIILNLLRMAAYHGIRCLGFGIDTNLNLTRALGYEFAVDNEELDHMDLAAAKEAVEYFKNVRGLYQVMAGVCSLDEVIYQSDLPNLAYIPENAHMLQLDLEIHRQLMENPMAGGKQIWLRDQIIDPLKHRYDLIAIDCGATWNLLFSQVLMACDVLLVPMECKFYQYLQRTEMQAKIAKFKAEHNVEFDVVYIPTKVSQRKLSRELSEEFQNCLPNCTPPIRDTSVGEESFSNGYSVPEYKPRSKEAEEINIVIKEIWRHISG